jgi:hypothetical protein
LQFQEAAMVLDTIATMGRSAPRLKQVADDKLGCEVSEYFNNNFFYKYFGGGFIFLCFYQDLKYIFEEHLYFTCSVFRLFGFTDNCHD